MGVKTVVALDRRRWRPSGKGLLPIGITWAVVKGKSRRRSRGGAKECEAAEDASRRHREAIEEQKTPQYKLFACDMKAFQAGSKRVGLPRDKLAMTQLNAAAVALHCKHGYHQQCSHVGGGRHKQQ